MFRNLTVVLISSCALALGACSSSSSSSDPCSGVTAPCTAFPAGTTESTISAAVSTAPANTTFAFAAGTFAFTNSITLNAATGVTITGAGMGTTILDFSGQVAGSAGITAASGNSKLTFSNFTVQNTPGDGIKVVGGNGVIFKAVQVTWTTPELTHGAYGIYPVQSQNILIDSCKVNGARDTGIYVGQSLNIIVSNNTATNNVAGIEIESSVNADVTGNESTSNSGGILVFALPGLLPPPGTPEGTVDATMNVRVYGNNVHDNNTANFGDPSGTVAAVPGGTGVVVMASTNVEVFGNTIANNHTAAYSVISYFLINPAFDPTDPANNGLNPFPFNVYAHDNTFTGNGTQPINDNVSPDGGTSPNQLGSLLGLLAFEGGFAATNNVVPDMIWDGIAFSVVQGGPYTPPSAPTNPTSVGSPPNPDNFFVQGNGSATFANLNFEVLASLLPDGGATIDPTALVFNVAPFTVTAPPTGFPLPGVDAGVIP
jgi:parallel beta-helix repeat protein